MKIEVYKGEANYFRTAYLKIENDKILFDNSDGEYGEIEFPLQLLKNKLKEYEAMAH